MIVNCPKCHLGHDQEIGKHCTCSCGTQFAVDESGKAILLPVENVPAASCQASPNVGSLASLSVDDLKWLKTI